MYEYFRESLYLQSFYSTLLTILLYFIDIFLLIGKGIPETFTPRKYDSPHKTTVQY